VKTGLNDGAMAGKTGDQFARLDDYSGGTAYDGMLTTTASILSSNLAAYIHYTLTCDITGQSTSDKTAIDLISGSTVIASVTNSVATANNLSANKATLHFMAYPDHPNLGETMAIRLRMVAGAWNQDCYFDNLSLIAIDTSVDTDAPTPNPMTWVQVPTAAGSNSVLMTCSSASDTNWVQYLFSNTVNGATSGWIEVTTWRDNGLTDGVTYGYKVKARDKSTNHNETAWSSEETATCNSNIVFYDSFEYPLVAGTATGTDPFGWKDASTGGQCGMGRLLGTAWTNTAGAQAAWLNVYNTTPVLETTITTLNATLLAQCRYALTFNAADNGSYTLCADLLAGTNVVLTAQKAPTSQNFAQNIASNAFLPQTGDPGVGEALKIRLRVTGGEWNAESYVDNLRLEAVPSSADSTPPTPDPMTWIQTPTPAGSNGIVMTCSTASDINYVQYLFSNTVNGATSGWIEVTTWCDNGLTHGVTYGYKVKARDKSANWNETAWSSEKSATADGTIIFYDSFEYPVVGSTATGTDPSGWKDASTGGQCGMGRLLGTAWTNTAGAQAAWLNVYNTTPILETTITNLNDIFFPACSYTLRFNAADNGSYTVVADMMAGTNVMFSAQVTPTSQNFSNHVAQQNFTSSITNTGLGSALKLRLRVTGGEWNAESYADNITLWGVRTNRIWNRYATNITDQAADFVGALTATGANVYVSAYWGTNDAGTNAGSWAYTNHLGWYNSVNFIYPTNVIASGLAASTKYYYTFRGSNTEWQIWDSTSGVFTIMGPPAVNNSTGGTPVSATSSIVRGNLTAGGQASAWICWGTSDAGTNSMTNWPSTACVGPVMQGDTFSTLASGLATNVTYWYRCFVSNAYGIAWASSATSFNAVPPGVMNSGGFVTNYWLNGTNFWAHIFTNSGTFTANYITNIEVLVVAGGGGSGQNGGGGGGAGGCIYSNAYPLLAGSNYMVTVGVGGAGAVNGSSVASSGSNSIFATITAAGGGGGASRDSGGAALSGGSGGGGGGGAAPQITAGTASPAGQGNNGAGGFNSGGNSAGGGGGGYSGTGTAGASKQGGNGGNGYWTDISGVYTGYCGGGAGSGLDYSSYGGKAGSVQAGAGGGGPQNNSRDGRPNSGGGGGGLGTGLNSGDSGGGKGGSGIVIVRYVANNPIANLAPTAVTNTSAVFNGQLSCLNTNYDVYVHWGTVDGTNNFSAWSANDYVGSWANVASTNICYTNNGLTAGATNYYTFRAANDSTNVWATLSWMFISPGSDQGDYTLFLIY